MVDKMYHQDGDSNNLTYLPNYAADDSIHADDVFYIKQGNILAIWRRDPEGTGANTYGWC